MDAALLSAARFASLALARTEMLEDGSERIGATTSTGGPELSIPLLTSSLAILVSVRQYPPYSNGHPLNYHPACPTCRTQHHWFYTCPTDGAQ